MQFCSVIRRMASHGRCGESLAIQQIFTGRPEFFEVSVNVMDIPLVAV